MPAGAESAALDLHSCYAPVAVLLTVGAAVSAPAAPDCCLWQGRVAYPSVMACCSVAEELGQVHACLEHHLAAVHWQEVRQLSKSVGSVAVGFHDGDVAGRAYDSLEVEAKSCD